MKHDSNKLSADKVSADKLSADKLSADKLAKEQPAAPPAQGNLANSLWDLTEWSFKTMDSALNATGRGLDTWLPGPAPSGRDPENPTPHADDLTAAWANQTLRAARRLWWAPTRWPTTGREIVSQGWTTLRQGARRHPRASLAALPLRLPISWASLWTQEGLRAIASARSVPTERLADFLDFVLETFSDLDIYFSLQYQQEIDRWKTHLNREPGDLRARLELGRTYLKCGLFEEAADHLRQAAQSPSSIQSRALYHALVANYRAGDLDAAFADGTACLQIDPEHTKARFWLRLTAEKAGAYPAMIPSDFRMEVRDGLHPTPMRFEEVSSEVGLDKVSGGRGTAVADFFGDGRLHVAVSGAHSGISLFRNRGDGTFEDLSVGSGLERCVYGFALAAGDYDNDGLPDLFVSSLGFYNGRGTLFHNEGGGVFRDVTREAGLDHWGPAFTATWVDVDGNGLLDLYVANNLGGLFDRKVPNRLYRNNGDGTFRDGTRDAGLNTLWSTIGACWGDFTNNGLPDLFVSSLGRAQLFRNRGDGTFEDVSRDAGIDQPAIGSVAMACDLDNNGWLDIVQATYSRPSEAIFTLQHGHGPQNGSPPRIFRNRGDGTFANASAEWGLTGCWGTMSVAAGDFENCGYQGLLLGNGDPSMDRTEASVLLANDGQTLRNVTFAAGLPMTGKGHGVNVADLSGDGRLHLLVASGGLYPGDLSSSAVYRPVEKKGRHLNIKLVGTVSNRDAIGARLSLEVQGRRLERHVSGGSGFGWAPLQQHFGLGDSSSVGTLRIRWPSGIKEYVTGLPIDSTVEITEGCGNAWSFLPRKQVLP